MRSRHAPRVIACTEFLLDQHLGSLPAGGLFTVFAHHENAIGPTGTLCSSARRAEKYCSPNRKNFQIDSSPGMQSVFRVRDSAEEWLKVGPQLLTECSSGKPTPPIESKLSGNDFLLPRRNLSQRCRVQIQVRRCHFGRHASDPVVQ